MKLWQRLWRDERGEAGAMGLILVVTILVLGSIVGLSTLRNQIVQEMGDLADSLESLNQSYSSSIGVYNDVGPFPMDTAGQSPAGITIQGSP